MKRLGRRHASGWSPVLATMAIVIAVAACAGPNIPPSGATGSGKGSVGFSVDANSGGQRIGALTIAGLTFTVVQNAAVAPLSLGPNASYTISGNQVTLHVDSVRNNRSGTSGTIRLRWSGTRYARTFAPPRTISGMDRN